MSNTVANLDEYALPAFVTFASLAQQARFARRVGLARMKYKVPVPETTGDPAFIRTFRAHQNGVEFYPIAVSSLWLSSLFFHPVPSAIAGAIYIYGRQKYFDGYAQDSEKRLPGFMLSVNALLALLAMSGAGVTTALLRRYADTDLAAIATDLINKVVSKQ
ncbi:microsomal glutathione S-transferase 2-like [Littorina saxatilis]|uniref:Microsomal glutathione S-transferase 2 n=1 Tax=Littorina saxatilis TaxID=31220 RepID=A0AAN9AVF4_9CAEN